jgi:predicted aldo/keto reductase-like oxidoreductase
MAYGYFPKGMNTILSPASLQWRELCLARARELGMGILAMKVLGSFLLGHNAKNIVPDFGEERLRALRQAAMRWALQDDRPPMLLIGVSIPGDIDENIRTLSAKLAFTAQDRKLLAEFSVKAWQSKTIQALKTT